MNKKIRAVVKHYEKNMKFESKFEQLSHKLDLIKDDTPLKSDVIVIRRKLIPAYMMSVLVMALVTGLIGLQIGLGNLKIKTEYINPVKVELEKHADIYLSNSVYSSVVGEQLVVNYYVGIKNDSQYLIINIVTNQNYGEFTVDYGDQTNTLLIQEDEFWTIFELDNKGSYNLELAFSDQLGQTYYKNDVLELTDYFDYLVMMYN